MKRNRIIVVVCLLAAVAALVWWLLKSSPMPVSLRASKSFVLSTSAKPAAAQASRVLPAPQLPIEEHHKVVVEKIQRVLATPITFYGKVIDQSGDPVPDAIVGYSALDKFMEPGTGYTGTSDKNGTFNISGIKGARLGVTVRKKGYYFIDGKSHAAFAYGTGADGYFKSPPTRDNPAIFVLHKMGETEPLISAGARDYKVSKDGQPLEVNLGTGKQVPTGQGDIRFERWASDQAKNEKGRFDWRFRITVPDGGIIERKNRFAFEAPQEGYHSAIEINMPASLGDKWSYTVEKSYFIKARGGHYARFNATIEAGHDNTPLTVDSIVNPKPGSRNLEFDPAKAIKSP